MHQQHISIAGDTKVWIVLEGSASHTMWPFWVAGAAGPALLSSVSSRAQSPGLLAGAGQRISIAEMKLCLKMLHITCNAMCESICHSNLAVLMPQEFQWQLLQDLRCSAVFPAQHKLQRQLALAGQRISIPGDAKACPWEFCPLLLMVYACAGLSIAECKLQGQLAGAVQHISIGVDTKVHLLLAVMVC